jgi:hypothetical protein
MRGEDGVSAFFAIPIINAVEGENGICRIKQEYGTAFSIGRDLILTAGHSVAKPDEPDRLIVALPKSFSGTLGTDTEYLSIVEAERIATHDIGVARVSINFENTFPTLVRAHWSFDRLPHLADVGCGGFPHALNILEFNAMAYRSHKGYIVAYLPHRFASDSDPFEIYEVSFQVAIGMSGAPLIRLDHGTVAGVLVGTRETDVRLVLEQEISSEGQRVETTTTVQRVHYGVAIPSFVIANLKFDLLGGTVREYLQRQGLVSARGNTGNTGA